MTTPILLMRIQRLEERIVDQLRERSAKDWKIKATLNDLHWVTQQVKRLTLDTQKVEEHFTGEHEKNERTRFEHILETMPMASVVNHHVVISVDDTSTVRDGFATRMIYMPVYDAEENVIGYLGLTDLFLYIVQEVESHPFPSLNWRDPETLSALLTHLEWPPPVDDTSHPSAIRLGDHPLSSVIQTIHGGHVGAPSQALSEKSPLYLLVKALESHVYAPICDEYGSVVNITDQEPLIRFLSVYMERLEPMLDPLLSIGDAPLFDPHTDWEVIHKDQSTHEALLRYFEKETSILGVVDDEQRLLGTLLESDFRDISLSQLGSVLSMDIETFCKGHARSLAVYCTKKTYVRKILSDFVMHKPRRIWMVDEEKQITGYISLIDVLHILGIVSKT